MSSRMNRRDFLKLVSLLPLLQVKWPSVSGGPKRKSSDPGAKNVLILIFDTLSARHVSLYGYKRETTPNLARFAERATVFHTHQAGGNFTSPGTASIFTGVYPWSHRAFNLNATVIKPFESQNIFSLFANHGYYQTTYTHNWLVTMLLSQFREFIDAFVETRELCLADYQFSDKLFPDDYRVAFMGEKDYLIAREGGNRLPGSLFLSWFSSFVRYIRHLSRVQELGDLFPRGFPNAQQYFVFTVEDAIDWVQTQVETLPQPYLAYVHLLPPHAPYTTRHEFIDLFKDGWRPPPKPEHFFSDGRPEKLLNVESRLYDEYIAYVDAEFGRLYDFMADTGALDNTYLVFTSDHGELFERGILGHLTPVLYQPVIQVPLLISQPGQQTRQDVYTPTSCVDLLPTLLHVTGQPIPDWCEGEILPTFNDDLPRRERAVFTVEAKSSSKFGALTRGGVAMVKDRYKLIHHFGYPGFEREFELYDLVNDPEELENLYATEASIAAELQEELEEKLRVHENAHH